MRVLITGGAGFLGRRLARALADGRTLAGASGVPERIDEIVLLDVHAADGPDDPAVRSVTGDVSDRAVIESVVDDRTTSIFHLAAVLSGGAEADFDLGLRVNVDATRALLDVCRARAHRPRIVFASSVAVFGGDLPDLVPETIAPTPQSSYGTQKAIGELLVADYSRKGFVDGRSLRLPTVVVRPGRPNAAASSFASSIVREPLHGRDVVCPVASDARIWIASPRAVVAGLITGHEIAPAIIGSRRSLNLPGLTVSAGDMAAALGRVAGEDVARRIRWERDPRIEAIVMTWPVALDAARALTLGFAADASFDAIVEDYIHDYGPSAAARASGSSSQV